MTSTERPRRTGLVVFSTRIFSVFTGLLFLVMITRWLVPAQFGLWEVINTIVAFSAYPVGVITYWATRDVARGVKVAKTTLAINQLASLIGVVIYLAFALLSYEVFKSNLAAFTLAIVLVPLAYWTQATGAIIAGYDPAVSGWSLLISEPIKLLAAYPLLYVFKIGIYGVILAIAASYFAQGVYTTYKLWPIARDKVDLSRGRKWLELWHVPSLGTLNYLLGMADTFVASLAQGATVLAGYYQAGFQVTTIIAYGQYLTVALYPALLKRRTEKLASDILEFSMLFAIPMAAGAISLAPQILYLLRPEYASVSTALVILAVAAVFIVISNVADQTLTGLERADLEKTDTVQKVGRSDLMFVPRTNLVLTACYIASVFAISLLGGMAGISVTVLVTYWAVAQLATWLILVAIKLQRLRRRAAFAFPKRIFGYAAVAALMAVVVHYAGVFFLQPSLHTLAYGLVMFGLIALGAAIYFGILAAVDPRVRGYFRAVLEPVMP